MKKILLFDVTFPQGHRELNNKLLKLLSGLPIQLLVINRDDYYYVESPNIQYKKPISIKVIKGTLLSRICIFINFLFARGSILLSKYDSVIYTTFPNVNFFFERFFYSESLAIILMHHNNIDLLAKQNIRWFFLKYANKVNHVVFAPYMKDYLIELGVKSDRIHYLPHPINLCSNFSENKEPIALSMGLESNDSFLKDLVMLERETCTLKQNGIKLIIRSKSIKLDDCDNVDVIRNYLSQEEYESLYRRAKYVFVFYPYTYKYRFSGVIMDALASGAIVIGNRIPIVEHFARMFPNNCKCIDEITEVSTIVAQDSKYSLKEYNSFLKEFSNESISRSLYQIISIAKKQ